MLNDLEDPLNQLKIAALLKFSTLDYPGKLSAVVFCQGCPIKCVYCHNPDFQDSTLDGSISVSDLQDFLDSRKGLLDAVVFSGGEPLMQHNILQAVEMVKSKGYLVGLHTAGTIPQTFKQILPFLDWVGFDIKTLFSKYETITQVPNSATLAEKSLKLLLSSNIDYEIRTTVDSRFISMDDLEELAKYLANLGIKKWVLQECILRNADKDLHLPFPSEQDIKQLSTYISIETRRQ